MMWLVRLAIRFCEWRGKVLKITGRDADGIYMVRYILFRWDRFFSIYIHQFLRSDTDTYHDHPWNFWTYVVQGSYVEHRPKQPIAAYVTRLTGLPSTPYCDTVLPRSTRENRLAYRRAEDLHWVEAPRCTYLLRHRATTTICLLGRRRRVWGFSKHWGDWVYWKTYLGITDAGTPSKSGDA